MTAVSVSVSSYSFISISVLFFIIGSTDRNF